MSDDIFTPDQVVKLFEHQNPDLNPYNMRPFHPFTCANRNDGNHRSVMGDVGILIPTVRGWICPFCDYTQTWAHDFMKRGK